MPQTINPVITAAGLAAAISAANNGTFLALTHLTLGAGQYTPAVNSTGEATQTDLMSRREKVAFGSGRRTGAKQITLGATFPIYAGAGYNVGEVGIWAGDPDNGGTLFAVYSAPGYIHAYRNDQTEFVESYSFAISKIPQNSVTVTVDPNSNTLAQLIDEHEAKANPHPQYFLRAELAALRLAILQTIYPVGSIYMTYNTTQSPSDLFGFGTWGFCGVGRVFIGQDPTDPDFDTVGEYAGSKNHTLSINEMPAHNHTPADDSAGSNYGLLAKSAPGQNVTVGNIDSQGAGNEPNLVYAPKQMTSIGGGEPFSLLPPYEVVRKWRRLPDAEATDTTPDAFAFTTQYGVPVSSAATSNRVQITGISTAAAITVTDCTYSVNGGPFTSAPGTISNLDTLALQTTAPSSNSTSKTVSVTVGTFTTTFSIQTEAAAGADTTPNAFSYAPKTGVAPNANYASDPAVISGINAPATVTITGGLYSINGGAFVSTQGTVNNGDAVTLKVTSSGSFNTATTATVTIGGVSASFRVTTAPANAITVTSNPSSSNANYLGTGSARLTSSITLSISGGTGPYTTTATRTVTGQFGSGIAATVNSPTSITFTSNGSGNIERTATFRMTVTDANGVTGFVDVPVDHSYSNYQ